MKRTHRCPKCDRPEILFIAEVADEARLGVEAMRIARVEQSVGKVLGFDAAQVHKIGVLEAGVCRECGYTEFYTRDAKQIPIDGKYVQLLKAKS